MEDKNLHYGTLIVCWLNVSKSHAVADVAATTTAGSYGLPGSPRIATILFGSPVLATFGLIRSIASALGEGIGWRGFLLPRLTSKFGSMLGCLISGCIWAVWH